MHRLTTYFKVWWLMAVNAFQETFINRGTNLLFILGKIVRVGMMLVFLFLVKNQVRQFAGYTTDQIVIFFLTYQFIDTLAQVFYRGVYEFQGKIRRGEFDFYLTKPIKPLFQSLAGKPDINDALFIVPTTIISVYIASTLNLDITWTSFGWYLLLLANGFLIATALHIWVLIAAILTSEVDGFIWMYRDLSQLARFPVSVYLEPIKAALFFIVPVGLMITIPSEVLLSIKPTYGALFTLMFGISFFILSLIGWRWGIKQYSSASS